MEEQLVKNAWVLCHLLGRRVLVISNFGEVRVYLLAVFNPKSRDVFVNSVQQAQDITEFAKNPSFEAMNMTKPQLEDKINNFPRRNFDFAHDHFMILNEIKENKY